MDLKEMEVFIKSTHGASGVLLPLFAGGSQPLGMLVCALAWFLTLSVIIFMHRDTVKKSLIYNFLANLLLYSIVLTPGPPDNNAFALLPLIISSSMVLANSIMRFCEALNRLCKDWRRGDAHPVRDLERQQVP